MTLQYDKQDYYHNYLEHIARGVIILSYYYIV